MAKLTDSDDIEAYLTTFEQQMQLYEIERGGHLSWLRNYQAERMPVWMPRIQVTMNACMQYDRGGQRQAHFGATARNASASSQGVC